MAYTQTPKGGKSRLFSLLLILVVLLAALLQRNQIYDAWRLHGYQAPSDVVHLADETTMTPTARHLFYVNHPNLINEGAVFRGDCPTAEQTIVLGCYHNYEQGIYVYNVQDNRLSGVQEVTAAHEMLHAAYDRLSSNDKKHIDDLLLNYYNNTLTDERVKQTIDSYKQTEPKDLVNEMHSIFGTEISSLPTELENYYKRYFNDRSAVIKFSDNYEQEFTTRENQAKNLESQLTGLKSQIDSEDKTLKTEYNDIISKKAQLDSYRNSGQTDSYNNSVESFNAEVDDYNAKISSYQTDVRRYNQLVADYNAVAGDLKSLYNSINASVQTVNSQ